MLSTCWNRWISNLILYDRFRLDHCLHKDFRRENWCPPYIAAGTQKIELQRSVFDQFDMGMSALGREAFQPSVSHYFPAPLLFSSTSLHSLCFPNVSEKDFFFPDTFIMFAVSNCLLWLLIYVQEHLYCTRPKIVSNCAVSAVQSPVTWKST